MGPENENKRCVEMWRICGDQKEDGKWLRKVVKALKSIKNCVLYVQNKCCKENYRKRKRRSARDARARAQTHEREKSRALAFPLALSPPTGSSPALTTWFQDLKSDREGGRRSRKDGKAVVAKKRGP